MKIPNWRYNLRREGGFWRDGRWYDLHLERRMPLALPMLEELVVALPPLPENASVCDLACGTGNAALTAMMPYPLIHLTLIDRDPNILSIALEKIGDIQSGVEVFQHVITTDGEPLPGGPFDVVLVSLAVNDIISDDLEIPEAETRYELLFRSIRDVLNPGGHLVIGDFVGSISLYRELKAMERAGFIDVDCAWRQDDFFVCGGRVSE